MDGERNERAMKPVGRMAGDPLRQRLRRKSGEGGEDVRNK